MLDIVFLALVLVFFGIAVLVVRACELVVSERTSPDAGDEL